jgi:hypothetical protein
MMLPAGAFAETLRDLWGPGLVFIVLCGWLVRRALRAARNESILEEQRLRDALGDLADMPAPTAPGTSPPPLRAAPTDPLSGADVRGASQEHLDVVAQLVREREAVPGSRHAEVLWVRSTPTHAVWAERRAPRREVVCVAQVDSGKVVARWQFG